MRWRDGGRDMTLVLAGAARTKDNEFDEPRCISNHPSPSTLHILAINLPLKRLRNVYLGAERTMIARPRLEERRPGSGRANNASRRECKDEAT